MTTQYSTVQKLSLAGTVIGALMCVAGGIAPYWLVSDPEAPGSFSFVASVAGKVFKVQFGLFIYCEELLGKQECRLHQLGSTSGEYKKKKPKLLFCGFKFPVRAIITSPVYLAAHCVGGNEVFNAVDEILKNLHKKFMSCVLHMCIY